MPLSFRTIVRVATSQIKIEPDDKIMFIGSCFSDEIFRRFKGLLFDAISNPFGTVYNPQSLNDQILRIIADERFSANEAVYNGEKYHSLYAHSALSGESIEELEENINVAVEKSRNFLQEAKFLIITFGTAFTYKYVETGKVVANCHKIDGRKFERQMLTVEEIVGVWRETINKIKCFNDKINIIFTVSPIRHLSDTAHGNQLSKATLLLAINEVINDCDVEYFPSYELLLDDLRDYRFYAKDMTHPSEVAVDYVFEQFSESYFSEKTKHYVENISKLVKSNAHLAHE